MKSPPTAEQQWLKREKELRITFNKAWSNVSLGHLKTLRDLLSYISVADMEHYASKEQLALPPKFDDWHRIIQQLVADEEKKFLTVKEDDISLKDLWKSAMDDSLIVSGSLYQAHKESRKSKPKIREIVAPLLPARNPLQLWDLFYFQQEAADHLLYNILKKNYRGQLLRANTGDGKTPTYAFILRALIDLKFHETRSLSPFPYLVVTAASIVEQTKRVLKDKFGLRVGEDVLVSNYEQLRSDLGDMFIKEKEIIVRGEAITHYEWVTPNFPVLCIWDESQRLKNFGGLYAKLAIAYSSIKGFNSQYTYQIFSSATPFSRVSAAKYFCLATKIPFKFGMGTKPLDEHTWGAFSSDVAYPAKPEDYDKPAMKRLLNRMDDYIVGFKSVRKKHKGITKVEVIRFATPQLQRAYEIAFEEYLENKRKIEGSECKNPKFLIFVEFLKFRQAASLLKAEEVADRLYKITQKGKAAVFADAFKPTIAKVVILLTQKYDISREQISLIWGGSAELSKETRYTKEEIKDIFTRAMKGEDIPAKTIKEITKQLQAEQAGLTNLPEELNLGIQSRKMRQQEIDNFQNGKSVFCLFTFGAGGAGLSLHHEYEHTRPREDIYGTTWNEMEVEQAKGRTPRLTSRSDTLQTILVYAGTIEIHVLAKSCEKGSVLSEVIKHSELPVIQGYDEDVIKDTLKIAGTVNLNEDGEEEDDEELGLEIFKEHEMEGEVIDV